MFNIQLKKIRTEKKLKQSDVADALGITVRQYQRYESGEQTTTLVMLIKLADYFNVTLDHLVGREVNSNERKL